MKRLLMAILLFHGFGLMAQNTLVGKYCNTDTWNWFCFEFFNDSLFKQSMWAYGGGQEIRGTYKLIDNKLILTYGNEVDSVKNYSKRLLKCDSIQKQTFLLLDYSKGIVEEYIIKKNNSKKLIIENKRGNFLFIKNGTEAIPPLRGEKEYCE